MIHLVIRRGLHMGCRAAMLAASGVTPITDKRQSMAEQMEMGARLTNHRFNVNGGA